MANLITLSELKTRLKISTSDTTYDDLLYSIIEGSSALIEDYCGRTFSGTTTLTETFDIDNLHQYLLKVSYIPIVSVSSIVDNGDTVDSSYYYIYEETGIIKTDTHAFTTGLQTVDVTYTGGYTTPPTAIKEVTKVLCASLFNRAGAEGIVSESMGDYSVVYRDPFYIRYSTEWNIIKDVLDKYTLADADSFT